MVGVGGGAVCAGAPGCAGASAWVAALARATCWRKVRRLVDIRYRVLWRAGGGGVCAGCGGAGEGLWREKAAALGGHRLWITLARGGVGGGAATGGAYRRA